MSIEQGHLPPNYDDIDVHIDTGRYITPPGGEIVVDSEESFEDPVERATDEELVQIREAFAAVLADARENRRVNAHFEERVIAQLDELSPDEITDQRLDEIIDTAAEECRALQ